MRFVLFLASAGSLMAADLPVAAASNQSPQPAVPILPLNQAITLQGNGRTATFEDVVQIVAPPGKVLEASDVAPFEGKAMDFISAFTAKLSSGQPVKIFQYNWSIEGGQSRSSTQPVTVFEFEDGTAFSFGRPQITTVQPK
jgi:hypothetical protein